MLMCNTSGCHSTSRLSIFDWNCNGLLAHRAELLHHIEITRNMYHVLCLQETFLKPGKHFSVAGYNVIRKDRTDGRKGGLLTLVREDLCYTVVNDVTELECIVVKVRVKGDFICVANVYIPPGDTVNLDVLNTLLCSRKTIIVGDLNAKSKLWGSPQADERGLQLEEKIEVNSAVVVNTGCNGQVGM